jgi:hypothetical protein
VRQQPNLSDPFKSSTLETLTKIVDPLIDLMLDAGVTVQEFSRIMRDRAVRRADERITKRNGRGSKSQVAIATGLPRSEVARILLTTNVPKLGRLGQHPARKVLAGWYDNPLFLSENGDPAVLPIFGARKSFERLVARYSGGIPVRAMLDQLLQIDAIELRPGQRVKANSRVPTFKGFNNMAIATIGDRTRDLLETLLRNLRAPTPLFEGTAMISDIDAETMPVIRKEIAEQGAIFIESANSLFNRSRNRTRQSKSNRRSKYRIGITAYYFQTDLVEDQQAVLTAAEKPRRKNLHRRIRKALSENSEPATSTGRTPT